MRTKINGVSQFLEMPPSRLPPLAGVLEYCSRNYHYFIILALSDSSVMLLLYHVHDLLYHTSPNGIACMHGTHECQHRHPVPAMYT